MQIGSFAGVVFEVSDKKILTPNEYSRSGSARWTLHDINLKKPIPEFIGPGQESLSVKIVLKASHGVSPEDTLATLRSFRDAGKVSSFILGSKPVTSGYWYIDDIQEGYKTIDNLGRASSVEVTLSLKEYPKPVEVRTKPASTSKASPTKSASPTGIITIKVNMLNCRTSPSLEGTIKKVLRKNDRYRVYGTVKTDITWYKLGGGLYCSAGSKYVSFKKA